MDNLFEKRVGGGGGYYPRKFPAAAVVYIQIEGQSQGQQTDCIYLDHSTVINSMAANVYDYFCCRKTVIVRPPYSL